MKNFKNLETILKDIDGLGYKAYGDIRGSFEFSNFVLSIDHVQGDPFAPPSRVRVSVKQSLAGFPFETYDTDYKRIAVVDFLTRIFGQNIKKYYFRVHGTGKSGLVCIDSCGQEILDRTAIVIDKDFVEARFEVGLPAAGRRVLGRAAADIFLGALPDIVSGSLFYKNIDRAALKKQVELSVDQNFIRHSLKERRLSAFVANGSILPRESGISSRPMANGAVPFESPETLEVEFSLPVRGTIKGMGIPEGITLIVGGGYHGKSTLLKALESGIYNHIEGDGREFVITRDNAVKIRAEDGRRVEKVDISPFIDNLPNGQDTLKFSTEDASGSTSQGANIMEALEIGTDLLLIDEDTCATNFMVRDKKMQQLISSDKEPIIPFISRVKSLYRDSGVSTILVAGSSGDFFNVADRIIMMEDYHTKDVTDKAKAIASEYENIIEEDTPFPAISQRVVLRSSFPSGPKEAKIKARGIDTISYDHEDIDLRYLEQIVDPSQVNTIAAIMEYLVKSKTYVNLTLRQITDKIINLISDEGLDSVSGYISHRGDLSMVRKFEIGAAINRFRLLKIK